MPSLALVLVAIFFAGCGTGGSPEGDSVAAESEKHVVALLESKDQFDKMIIENKFVVADFFSKSCGPCRAMEPELKKVATMFPNVKVVKIDTAVHSDLAKKYGVLGVPSLFFFKDGELVDKNGTVGFRNKSALEKLFKEKFEI